MSKELRSSYSALGKELSTPKLKKNPEEIYSGSIPPAKASMDNLASKAKKPYKPRSQTIAEEFIEAIQNGKLRSGDRLPTEKELMRQEQIGRDTARTVIQKLRDANLVHTRQGKGGGTFVKEHPSDDKPTEENETLVYVTFARSINDAIRTGELKPGDKLPSLNKLQQQYSLGRNTLRRGIAVLRDSGLVFAKNGDKGGIFVTPSSSWKNDPQQIKSPPIHQATTNALRTRIQQGEFGSKLPSERELQEQLGVPRRRLREALEDLEKEGRIIRKIGIGTFVAPQEGINDKRKVFFENKERS